MSIDILAFGEALIDVLPSGEVVGGAPLNFATRCAEIGAAANLRSGLASCVGQDGRGERILAQLHDAKVDTSLVVTSAQHQTGFVTVDVSTSEAEYQFSDEPAWEHIPIPSPESLTPKLVYFGSLALKSKVNLTALQSITDNTTAIRLLDLNLRLPYPSPELVAELLSMATVAKCNSEELLWLASKLNLKLEREDEIASALIEEFSLIGLLSTWGREGCKWHGPDGITEETSPSFPHDLFAAHPNADTVGAGDAACAALAVNLIQQTPPKHLVRSCNLAGAFAARTQGPTHPMPAPVMELFR
ncbi:MAG: PfkB family carbohydrate kinase [Planctomycetota bacterium]